ncbi:Hypothetical protein LUCI_0280 [Lucifera butyrica]|uniref:Acid sugar phosphatase n=1 Tax=Lucifera butyrica TaxID=1351585 RepID=A0A498R0V9_9FIRM|nr:Hypothetical protein LUCI_0280 [Lucifera butyrica]
MKNLQILKQVKCFILDLDGTVYLGKEVLDGSIEFLKMLEQSNIQFRFFTNNSSKNAGFYIRKLSGMGFSTDESRMLISNQVIIDHLQKNMTDKKVFVLGNEYLKSDFVAAGIRVVEEEPDVVAVGFDTSLVYERVAQACRFIRQGAVFLGVNPDLNCPVENGFIPDCGSICAMISASTGVKPEYFGKPSFHTLQYILQNTGFKENEIAFVGDRLYTDIAIGQGTQAVTILVLSGETQPEDLAEAAIQPMFTFPSLKELTTVLRIEKKPEVTEG